MITDPREVRKHWEDAKAYCGKVLPPWMETMPDQWPPRLDDYEHQSSPRPMPTVGTAPPWALMSVEVFWAINQQPMEPVMIQRAEEPRPRTDFKKLKAARRKFQVLGDAVRSEAFDDWLRRNVVNAQRPDEWTQSRDLYEAYVRHAGKYGNNRNDKRLAIQVLATETAWGKMMGSLFPNKQRRGRGNFYPVRLKKGA